MSNTKPPLTDAEFDSIRQVAVRKDKVSSRRKYRTSDDGEMGENEIVILLLRYTGMHVSILAKPEQYNLRVDHEEGMIIWNRTKKEGREAYTSIPIHKSLTFDIDEYINDIKKRKRRVSRQFFFNLIKDIGERAGKPDLSPMSFRHTLCVSLLNEGYPEQLVRQTMNVSPKVMNTYAKFTDKHKKSMFEKMGWCR